MPRRGNEATILAMLKYQPVPNIIPVLRMFEQDRFAFAVMPFLHVLSDAFLDENIGVGVRPLLFRMSFDLANGLEFLHSTMKIAHCDLKPDNLVFDDSGQLMLTDFGLSVRIMDEKDTIMTTDGTEGWKAPEQASGPFSPILADLWCCGAIFEGMYTFHTGDAPGLKDFSRRLMDDEPSRRPSLTEWISQKPDEGFDSDAKRYAKT